MASLYAPVQKKETAISNQRVRGINLQGDDVGGRDRGVLDPVGPHVWAGFVHQGNEHVDRQTQLSRLQFSSHSFAILMSVTDGLAGS